MVLLKEMDLILIQLRDVEINQYNHCQAVEIYNIHNLKQLLHKLVDSHLNSKKVDQDCQAKT
jgi:hypothetical protein